MSITSNFMGYKSYVGVRFNNGAPNGHPCILQVKVFTGKKERAEVSVLTGHFSESRGVGSTSTKTLKVTNPETVALCKAAVKFGTGAVMPLVDKLQEEGPEVNRKQIAAAAARWFNLSTVENVSRFVDEENRDRAFADKKFAVGDKVMWIGNPMGSYYDQRKEVTITSERFEWHPYMGGGWRYGSEKGNSPQNYYRKIEG
jgi:hypothetical protein